MAVPAHVGRWSSAKWAETWLVPEDYINSFLPKELLFFFLFENKGAYACFFRNSDSTASDGTLLVTTKQRREVEIIAILGVFSSRQN